MALSKITVKKWQDMTREEKDAAIRSDELARVYQGRVKAKEAALDALQAYLKSSKRKRPAPTMMYQYISYRQSELDKLTAAIQLAQVEEDTAQHAWLHSNKYVSNCSSCEGREQLKTAKTA